MLCTCQMNLSFSYRHRVSSVSFRTWQPRPAYAAMLGATHALMHRQHRVFLANLVMPFTTPPAGAYPVLAAPISARQPWLGLSASSATTPAPIAQVRSAWPQITLVFLLVC